MAVGLKKLIGEGSHFKIENAFFTIDLFIYNGSKSQLGSVPRSGPALSVQIKKSTKNNKKIIKKLRTFQIEIETHQENKNSKPKFLIGNLLNFF